MVLGRVHVARPRTCKLFLEWVQQRGFSVKQLNSDSGGEYTANENAKVISEFEKVSKLYKVTQNFTSAHTPEQNGVSERFNRTLLESGRALLVNAGLAKEFWSLAVVVQRRPALCPSTLGGLKTSS